MWYLEKTGLLAKQQCGYRSNRSFSAHWDIYTRFFMQSQHLVAFFCDLQKAYDTIQFVKEAKFLCLIWDTKLTFEPHIKYLKARCQKSLNILKVLSRAEVGADQTTLLKLYRSLVRSKLDYGCIVYGSGCKTVSAKLDHVHNQGLSHVAFRSSAVESVSSN